MGSNRASDGGRGKTGDREEEEDNDMNEEDEEGQGEGRDEEDEEEEEEEMDVENITPEEPDDNEEGNGEEDELEDEANAELEDEDYSNNAISPAPPSPSSLGEADSLANSPQHSPIFLPTPPPPPPAQSTTAKKSTRPRRASSMMNASSISAPTGGKPKLYSQQHRRGHDHAAAEEEEEDEEDEEEDEDARTSQRPSSSTRPQKKRAQTFGNDNTATAETLLQQANRPYRNLDISLPLRVDVLGERAASSAAALAAGSTAAGSKQEEAKYVIPAPVAASKSDAAATAAAAAAKTASPVYIRLQNEWLRPHDYEITVEDENWLKQSVHCVAVVSPALFEKLINQFEIYTGATTSISMTAAKAHAEICSPLSGGAMSRLASDEIFQYWSAKRNKNKRSLVRRFWVQPTEDNRHMTNTFLPRDFDNRYKLRKKRLGDLEAYKHFLTLRKGFDRMLDLANLAQKRETLKCLEVDLVHAEYLEKLATASGSTAMLARPACLDVAVPEVPVLEPMESTSTYAEYSTAATQQQPHPQQQHRSRASTGGGGGHRSSGAYAAAQHQQHALTSEQRKKSHKRKQPGDEGYVALSGAGSGGGSGAGAGGLATNPIPFYFPEALYFRDDPVPLPLFLLDDARLLRENPYRATKFPRLDNERQQQEPLSATPIPSATPVTRLGRNRRVVSCAPPAHDPQPVEPSLAARQRIHTLLQQGNVHGGSTNNVDEDLVVIERIDLALLRGNEGAQPKFQLLV